MFRQNPVFQVLAEIQRDIDVFPNPQEPDFKTCRAKRGNGKRCRNPPCTKENRCHIPRLLSEFQDMSECPDTESFHDKIKTFIEHTHCKNNHRGTAIEALHKWQKERAIKESTSRHSPALVAAQSFPSKLSPRSTPSTQSISTSTTIQPITAAALQLLPSTPTRFTPPSASATSDDGSSFVDSIAESRSVTSNTTLMSSLPNTPLRNETISRFDVGDVLEEESLTEPIPKKGVVSKHKTDEEVAIVQEHVEHNYFEKVAAKGETIRDNIIAPKIKQEYNAEKMRNVITTTDINTTLSEGEDRYEREDTVIKGLGITGVRRNGSIRDHSPVFQVINSHPTLEKMKEGVVYILGHKENSSLFKIGHSSKSAKERLQQSNNCYGVNTKIIYETKRFVGAPQAEKIAQTILRHVNIRVLECLICQGGHREWFKAPKETVCETVMHVEEFLQVPAYTLQDGVYKLSPEAYDRVVKPMCDFTVARLGELMRGPRERHEETEAAADVLIDTKIMPLGQLTDEPAEISRPNTSSGLPEMQEVGKSFVSISSHETKSQQLSARAKLARKVKRLLSVGDSAKA